MKKSLIIICSLVIVLTLTSAYIIKYATGHAGATGAPGENTCTQCHLNGTFNPMWSAGLSGSSTGYSYIPGQTYTVSIYFLVNSSYHYGKRGGLGCEILDGVSVLSADAGVMTSTLNSTKFITSVSGRKNATHIIPEIGSNAAVGWGYPWQFTWVAPNTDSAVFYLSGVIGPWDSIPANDAVSTFSVVYTKNTSTNVNKIINNSVSLNIYPNPTSDNFKLSYSLENNSEVKIELTDLQGKQIAIISDEKQAKGFHSLKYDLPEIKKGVYFIKLSLNDKAEVSRLVIIQ